MSESKADTGCKVNENPDLLKEARKIIDEVDGEMAQLFEKRMNAVRLVAEFKLAHKLPVLDAAREKEVIARNVARIETEEFKPYFEQFLIAQMAISRAMQKEWIEKAEKAKS